MPIRPRKTRSCSTRSSSSSRANASFGSEPEGDAERAQRLAGKRLVARQDLARGAPPSEAVASSPTSSCEQRASRTSGAPLVRASRRSCLLGVAVNRAHQLALGGERHLARCARSGRRAPRPPARPCAPRRSARPRSDRPAPSSARRAPAARRCWRGRRRRARARARTGARRRSPRPRPAAPRLRARSRCRSKLTLPARRDDPTHRHLVLGERAGLVGGDDVRRAERLDRREMAHDGVPSSPCAARRARARPSPPPAGLPAPPRPRAPRRG